jgi:hypothetical protein
LRTVFGEQLERQGLGHPYHEDMGYLSAKSDLAFMEQLRANVEAMWAKEDAYADWRPPTFHSLEEPPDVKSNPDYQAIRERVAKDQHRAQGVARRLEVGHSLSNILWDGQFQPPRQDVRDAPNAIIGAAEHEFERERRHVRNPLWWVGRGVDTVLGLPTTVLVKLGANRDKLENEVWPKVITPVLIAALLVWLGLK